MVLFKPALALAPLLADATPFTSQKIASGFLNNDKNHKRRSNIDSSWLEEASGGNLFVECVEEVCSKQEALEAFENQSNLDSDANKKASVAWWQATTRTCQQGKMANMVNEGAEEQALFDFYSKNEVEKWSEEDLKHSAELANMVGTPKKCISKRTRVCRNKWRDMDCTCKSAYTGKYCEQDINECTEKKDKDSDVLLWEDQSTVDGVRQCGGECKNFDGGWYCAAPRGSAWKIFKQGDKSYDLNAIRWSKIKANLLTDSNRITWDKEDIDECQQEATCGAHNICENSDGSFACNCSTGYELADINSPNGDCISKNECEDDPCGAHTYCVEKDDGYNCECLDGFEKGSGDQADDHSCIDIKECDVSQPCLFAERCIEEQPGYSCQCNQGETLYEGQTDEAGRVYDVCCAAGSKPVAQASDAANSFECEEENPCNDKSLCDYAAGQVCVDMGAGEYSCICDIDRNYEGDAVNLDFSCRSDADDCNVKELQCDLNECRGENPCVNDQGVVGKCTNTIGSYDCAYCEEGFQHNQEGVCVADCDEVDRCGDLELACGMFAVACNNICNAKECVCMDGSEVGDQGVCVDIDECATGTHECAEGQQCFNLDLSYECTSPLDESVCGVNNPCDHECNHDPTGERNFVCSCWDGYVLSCDGFGCITAEEEEEFDPSKYSNKDCPEGFIRLGKNSGQEKCFYASKIKMPQSQAASECEKMGSTLAIVDTKEQNWYLSQWVGVENSFWIDGKKNSESGEFEWNSTGENWSSNSIFTSWAENEPSGRFVEVSSRFVANNAPENCVVSNWIFPGDWNDIACEHEDMTFACSVQESGDGSDYVVVLKDAPGMEYGEYE